MSGRGAQLSNSLQDIQLLRNQQHQRQHSQRQQINLRSIAFQSLQVSNSKKSQHTGIVEAEGGPGIGNQDLEVIMAEKKRIAQKRIRQACAIIEPSQLYRRVLLEKKPAQNSVEEQNQQHQTRPKGGVRKKTRQSSFRQHLRTMVNKQMMDAQRPKQVPVKTYELETTPPNRRSPIYASSGSSSGESPTATINRVYKHVLNKKKVTERLSIDLAGSGSDCEQEEDVVRIIKGTKTSQRSSNENLLLSPVYPVETAKQALHIEELTYQLERYKASSRSIDTSSVPFKSTNLSLMLQEARFETENDITTTQVPKAILSPRSLIGPTVGSIMSSSVLISPQSGKSEKTHNIGGEAHRQSKMRMMQKLAKYSRNVQQKSTQMAIQRLVDAPMFKVKAINNTITRQAMTKQKPKLCSIFKTLDQPVKKFWEQESILSPISVTRAIISDLRGQFISKSIDNEVPSPILINKQNGGQISSRIANQDVQLTLMPHHQNSAVYDSPHKVTHFARYANRIETERKNQSSLGRESKMSKSSDMLKQAQAELNITLQAQKKRLNFGKALAAVQLQQQRQAAAASQIKHHPVLKMHKVKSRIVDRLLTVNIERQRQKEAIRQVITRDCRLDEEPSGSNGHSRCQSSDIDETFYLEGSQELMIKSAMGLTDEILQSGQTSPHLKATSGLTISPWRQNHEKSYNSCLE